MMAETRALGGTTSEFFGDHFFYLSGDYRIRVIGVVTELWIRFSGEPIDVHFVYLFLGAVLRDGDVDVTAGLWVIGPVQGDTFDFGATDRNLVASIAVINILGLGHYMPERGIAVLGVGELVVLVFGAGKETGDLRDGAKGIDLLSHAICLALLSEIWSLRTRIRSVATSIFIGKL